MTDESKYYNDLTKDILKRITKISRAQLNVGSVIMIMLMGCQTKRSSSYHWQVQTLCT